MKIRRCLVLMVLLMGFILYNFSPAQQGEEEDPDNFGILRGRIIDPDTQWPVFEKFLVLINDQSIEYPIQLQRFGTETDDNGFFNCRWRPGTYLIYFHPLSPTSRYCWDLNFSDFPGERQLVTIEKGKITEIVKKAIIAGRLKLIMISKSGDRINPKDIFGDNVDCSVIIRGGLLIDNISGEEFTSNRDNFNDGEMLIYCLPPGLLDIDVSFKGMGIPSQHIKNIEIKKDSTTEKEIIVDLDDPTGIQGVIYYEDGEFIENVDVDPYGPEGSPDISIGNSYTNKNGFYRIVGLKEGIYTLFFKKDIGSLNFLYIPDKDVVVKKGSLSRVDVRVKRPH